MKHTFTYILFFSLFFNSFIYGQSDRKADKLYELFEFEQAIEEYLAALEAGPANLHAMARIADCHRMLNNMEESADWYLKVVRRSEVDPVHLLNYGKVLMALARYQEASTWFLNYASFYPAVGKHYAESCRTAASVLATKGPYEIRAEYINSVFSDFGPAFYQNKLVMASARTDIPLSAKRDRFRLKKGIENQLFISDVLSNGFLERPSFYHSEVGHSKNEGPVAFSADGKWVAYTKNNFRNGVRPIQGSGMQLSIYVAAVDANGNWVDAKPFPHNGNDFSTGFPWLSADGMTLYFASDRPDSYGGFDIFYSKKEGNDWSVPVNVGNIVNTPGNEITPFLYDQKLFFASDWHHGIGGLDLFVSEQATANTWTSVKHLGNGINSPYDDFGIILGKESDQGYFVSNRPGGKGKEDIYRFAQKMDVYEFLVLDASTRKPVPQTDIDLSACGQPAQKTSQSGTASVAVVAGSTCEVWVRKAGYTDYSLNLDGAKKAGKQVMEVSLIKKDERFLGKVVHAESNKVLEDVRIFATNQLTGVQTEAVSNREGEFILPLISGTPYVLRFSKPGFLEIKKRVEVTAGNAASFLGATYLQPSYSRGGQDVPVIDQPEEDAQGVAKEDPDRWSRNSPREGYAIQVGAFFQADGEVDLSSFNNLKELGNLYTKREGKSVKVRLGIYSDRMQAEEVREKINEKGYAQTFIVEEMLDAQLTTFLLGEDPVLAETISDSNPASGFSPYKIQLGAYSDPANFNGSKIQGLGIIEERQKGKLTLILLGGFSSLENARQAYQQVHNAGFHQAFLVMDQNGILSRVP